MVVHTLSFLVSPLSFHSGPCLFLCYFLISGFQELLGILFLYSFLIFHFLKQLFLHDPAVLQSSRTFPSGQKRGLSEMSENFATDKGKAMNTSLFIHLLRIHYGREIGQKNRRLSDLRDLFQF